MIAELVGGNKFLDDGTDAASFVTRRAIVVHLRTFSRKIRLPPMHDIDKFFADIPAYSSASQ